VATRRRASKSTLTGNITDLQRRVRYLQAKPVPSKLANQVVTRTAIQPRAVSTDQIALAAVTNDQVAADAIRQEQLANLSVGNPELQDNSVLNRNIARDAVNAESIEINAVGSAEIADNAVGSGEIADNAVGSSEIADSAVGSSEIATDAVGQSEIAPNSVGTAELQDSAVTSAKIGGLEVKTANIDDRAVTGDKIGINTVNKNNIAEDSVGPSELEPLAVRSTELADSAVTTAKIGNLQVTGEKIANGAVGAGKVTRGVLTSVTNGVGTLVTRFDNGAGGTGFALSVQFGSGSQEAARGNHTHGAQTTFALSGANRHQHSVVTGPPSITAVKKDITNYTFDNIKNLLKLEPKRYKYKRNKRNYQQVLNKEWMYGYLIEELTELGFNEPVGYDEDGNPANLDYGLMSLLVLELVKVQQTEIDSLKEEVLRLKDTK
jgi:hypothetical protein